MKLLSCVFWHTMYLHSNHARDGIRRLAINLQLRIWYYTHYAVASSKLMVERRRASRACYCYMLERYILCQNTQLSSFISKRGIFPLSQGQEVFDFITKWCEFWGAAREGRRRSSFEDLLFSAARDKRRWYTHMVYRYSNSWQRAWLE